MKVLIGNLFESNAKTLVNTVNCVGVMGKGVAKEFKTRYPTMYNEYVLLCDQKVVKAGQPYYYEDLYGASVINFPTKEHWRSPSKLSYIIDGLNWFRENYKVHNITSVAFPPLGCGNGGLTWEVVGPIMFSMLSDLPIDIEIYAPFGTPPEQLTEKYLKDRGNVSTENVAGKKAPKFNRYWLLILYVVQRLNRSQYSLNVGRTIFQKICYILTREGIPTGFNFVESSYGPYSNEVKYAITALSNSNYMTERKLGQMLETVVVPDFVLPRDMFTQDEINCANRAYDLLSRVKSTEQAETIATVLFSYDELSVKKQPTEEDIFNHVLNWKKRWDNQRKQEEILVTIVELSELGWMTPCRKSGVLSEDEEWF